MSTITTQDGTQIYYKDWGAGQPVVFSHGWPLRSDRWEAQMLFLADNGYRCIAHDRRGHGCSSQPWNGNEMDTFSDDLAELIETLALKDVVLTGAAALSSAKLVKNATLKIYPGAPTVSRIRTKTHSMPTCWHSLIPDLLTGEITMKGFVQNIEDIAVPFLLGRIATSSIPATFH